MSAADRLFATMPHSAIRGEIARGRKMVMPVVVFENAATFKKWAPDETELTFEEHTKEATKFMALVTQEYKEDIICFPAVLQDKPFAKWLKQEPGAERVFVTRDFGLPNINKAAAIRTAWADERKENLKYAPGFTLAAFELTPEYAAASAHLRVFAEAPDDDTFRKALENAGVKFIKL